MNNQSFGFQSAGSGSPAATATKTTEIAVPALVAGVSQDIAHGLTGCTKFNYVVRSSVMIELIQCYQTLPASTTHFTIESPVGIPILTLTVVVTGFN